MGADVNACPSARVLQRLLAEELAGTERNSVETHVEHCPACQHHLEGLVAATAPDLGSSPLSLDNHGHEPGDRFLSRLRELMPPQLSNPDSVSDTGFKVAERLGPYEILGKLGKGGMGMVYRARHSELGKVVALKVLPVEQMDEIRVARFKKEVRAIGQLDHPNIVAAYDAGEARGVHFLVMELVDGQDLARVIERYVRLRPADACEAVRQAAVALQHAFERGLVHRDVKPNNLMLDRDGRLRLLDLGLARVTGEAAGDALTAQGMVIGTADYLAPEQWDRPQAADTRADVYGLGCTLYHALVGRPPFGEHRTLPRKITAHLNDPPPPIERFCRDIPPGLGAVLARMLAKNPDKRYSTPGDAAAALQPFTAGAALSRLVDTNSPVNSAEAATPTPGACETDRVLLGRRRSVKRRRAVAIVAGLALLAAAAASLAWFWGNPALPVGPFAVTEFRVLHFRDKGKTSIGDLRTSAAAIRLNDNVQVLGDFTRPANYYLIALNPRGSEGAVEQLCQPEDPTGNGARDVRPASRDGVRYPSDSHDFFVDAVGLQAFVLAASTRPLPPYSQWRAKAGKIPWEGRKDAGTWRWQFDGRTFTRFPRERGRIESREDVPEELQKLRSFFADQSEFDVVLIVAFPVADDAK
jgi:serine/threonine protein kinase